MSLLESFALRAQERRSVVGEIFSRLSRASGSAARTTAMAPLHITLVLVLGALLSSIMLMFPLPFTVLFGVAFSVVLILECVAYLYLLFKNPDALRSERYTLEKLRIEKGLVGDSLSGFREGRDDHPLRSLPIQADNGP